jgi:inorganic pyrophosphatase
VFFMEDEEGVDAKVLCVPATDPRWSGLRDIDDVPTHLLNEIGHFFDVYKELEPGKETETRDWKGVDVAEKLVIEARERASNDHGEAPASSG